MKLPPSSILSEAAPLAVFSDFDGVMTDNCAWVDHHGTEFVRVSRADGLGVRMLRGAGIYVAVISSEESDVVQARCQKLEIDAYTGCWNKEEPLLRWCEQQGVPASRVWFVGNDVNDHTVMGHVGVSLCPSDGNAQTKEIATFVLDTPGGGGCLREVADLAIGRR